MKRVATVFLWGISGLAAAQPSPDGLQFNVPYLCNDGHTYVVHRCEKAPKFEACFYQREQDSERYNTREAVVYQMTKMCKVQGQNTTIAASSQPSPTPPVGVYHCTNGFILTISKCDRWNGVDACYFKVQSKGQVLIDSPGSVSGVAEMLRACNGDTTATRSVAAPPGAARATDPAYLADMPSADRVRNEIKGSDPIDTMARQVAVFTWLVQYIQRIKSDRSVRTPYTPDEQALLNAYNLALYRITEEYGKFHTPAEATSFQRLHWKYEMDSADTWAKQLMGKQSTAAYNGAVKDLSATGKEHYNQEMRTYEEATARQRAGSNQADTASDHYAKDAGSVAARHCLESGRSEIECLGEGLKVGARDLFGGDPLERIVPKTPVGLRLTGWYTSANFGLNFLQDKVGVKCGTLVPQWLPYTVERTGIQIRVDVPIAPKPLILSFRPGGDLAGPGPIEVAGQIVIGGAVDNPTTSYETHTATTTTQRQIDASDVPNYSTGDVHQNGMEYSVDQQTTSSSGAPTMTHHYSVPTAPKTERCNVGVLPPASANFTVSGALTNVLGTSASRSSNTAPGLRLNGTYSAAGGLKIEFRDDSATLECGESFNSEGYAVTSESGQLIVKFQNSTPLSLVLQPNGELTGPDAIDVAGRRAIQAQGGGVDYLPRSAHCSLGTLAVSK